MDAARHHIPVHVYKARQARVRELIETEHGGSQARFADAIGRPANYVSRMLSEKKGHKNIGEELARLIEQRHGKPTGWLDSRETSPHSEKLLTLHGLQISAEAVRLGRKWARLTTDERRMVQSLIEAMLERADGGPHPRAPRHRTQ